MLDRIVKIFAKEGISGVYRRGTGHQSNYTKGKTFPQTHAETGIQQLSEAVGLNLCWNGRATEQFVPDETNILLLLESPAVVIDRNWVSPDLSYDAEISFHKLSSAPVHSHCQDLYVNSDTYVEFLPQRSFDKSRLVSMIYSFKSLLEGQALRHEIAAKFEQDLDLYGTGFDGQFVDKRESLDKYMFQVVVENGLYPYYVSEKLFDCFKTQTIPIYRGGIAGADALGFDMDGIISFRTLDELQTILGSLSKDLYKELRSSVIYNSKHLGDLRTEAQLNFYYNQVNLGYMTTSASYFDNDFRRLNCHLSDR